MPLIKTLSQTLKQDKEKFKVPKSVQQAIPIRKIWPDGIFQVESKYSRTFRFTDINYSIASKADKTEMFLDYSELLNALDSGCTAKITLNNRKINKEEFEQSLLIPMKGDGLDEYRKEYNDMLLSKISGTNNSIYQERYLTISVHKKNIDEARTYFARVGTDIITHLAKLSSIGEELDAEQRLQIFRDFFKADVPQSFPFDMKAFAKKGHSFKDWICPDTMEFHNDHFKLGEQYGRVLFMEDYASYQISMVFQRVYLFQDTIYNNIIMGKPDATEEEIYEAARKARCYDFIMALPDGFQTVVGEGGATLSGGEKQRISIARCILKDAPIVILDEATASVDTDNESYIQEAISELVKGKTLLVIAHRLNTIQNADQILVIDNGQIAQRGTHEELLKQPGIYQDFVNIRKSAAGWSLA